MASKLPGLISVGRLSTNLPSPLGASSQIQQKRTIVSREYLKLPDDYPDPWPYQDKGFTRYHFFLDWSKKRFHENSKLIVVDGNIGSGKSKVAKELAERLGFKHMPEFKMEDILIDRYGNDLRKFYHLFPKCMRMPDINMFYANPFDINTARMQYRMYECRWEQYINAIAHILNTGEGVVLERSPHTDFVFTNAMRAKNYIGPEFFNLYYFLRKSSLPCTRYWPHLVIYLDAPVDKCLERIKQRGNANEIACVDEKYLGVMADSYKDALREFKRHSKILVYDWANPGDTDTIIQDIEKIDFDFFEWHSGDVFEEWHEPKDEYWVSFWRYRMTEKWQLRIEGFNDMPTHECGELYVDIKDLGHFVLAMKTHVLGGRLGYGYYPEKGDDRGKGMRAWQWTQHLPEPWHEYYWRDTYFHRLHSFETYFDPYAYSYDPDYLAHSH